MASAPFAGVLVNCKLQATDSCTLPHRTHLLIFMLASTCPDMQDKAPINFDIMQGPFGSQRSLNIDEWPCLNMPAERKCRTAM